MDLFGFKRRAQERAIQARAVQVDAAAKAYAHLTTALASCVASKLSSSRSTASDLEVREKVRALEIGIDAVIFKGADAFGSEITSAERHVRAGAMLAHACRNNIAIFGKFDDAQLREDFDRLLINPGEIAASTDTA